VSGAIWDGFTSQKWDPEACRAEREAWQAEHGPRLKERDRQQAAARARAMSAWATLDEDQQAALRPFIGAAITCPTPPNPRANRGPKSSSSR
jgi:hypothetical protein